MKPTLIICTSLLFMPLTFATYFQWPAQFTQWESGGKAVFRLIGESCKSGAVKLIDNGGFAPKNLGYLIKEVEIAGDDLYEFDIWDEIPAGDTYQLGFYPGIGCGKATTAFSYYFTIKKPERSSAEKHKEIMA